MVNMARSLAFALRKNIVHNWEKGLFSWCQGRSITFTNNVEPSIGTNTDVLIIGGGAMGASIAYWLKEKSGQKLSVMVVEKDPSYCKSSTCLSVGGMRQQFSLPENIQLSLFGADFLKQMGKYLSVDNKPLPDVNFQECGYLFMASERGVQTLKENSELQCNLGAKNILLTPSQLKNRFGWINTKGIELACLGVEREGWFDPWALLQAFKLKSISLGAEFIQAEVVGFDSANLEDKKRVSGAIIKLPDGDKQIIKFEYCVIAAGANSGNIAAMASIGGHHDTLSVCLPIEPRKRYVYCFHCPDGPGLDTPLVVDPSGAYFRREGTRGCYIAGMSPDEDNEPVADNLFVDYDFYDEKVWPIIANRVPAFQKSKLHSGWAGFYEFNKVDANGVIGQHPDASLSNIFFACGFSGHGIQHSPAVGRALSELIIHGQYKTIDLSRLAFDRHCLGKPLIEQNIV